jgi:DNA-binding GntR family transcriptional regulator
MQLRQESIAADYGVSRMPVREALSQLAAEGLVALQSYRGAVVTRLSVDDIREVLDLRVLIECDLLARAVPHLMPGDIAAARRHDQAFNDALTAGGEALHDLGEINARLHAALYGPARRTRSMQILQSLHYQTARYVRSHMLLAGGGRRARAEHAALIDLCASGRADDAVRCLRHHIEGAGSDLVGMLDLERARAAAPAQEGAPGLEAGT